MCPSMCRSDSSYRPVSPPSPADISRKRPAAQQGPVITKDDFTLPPPPTRSRKIIQMKPRDSEQQQAQQQQESLPPSATTSPAVTGRSQSTSQQGGKRKQNNNGQTAAGRKIARKTAHSLIERRRRSKMNEEFGVLKDMIPACKGQEMHKLAILQVGGRSTVYKRPKLTFTSGQHRISSLPGTMCRRPAGTEQLTQTATTTSASGPTRR
jgi:hypothetical protein